MIRYPFTPADIADIVQAHHEGRGTRWMASHLCEGKAPRRDYIHLLVGRGLVKSNTPSISKSKALQIESLIDHGMARKEAAHTVGVNITAARPSNTGRHLSPIEQQHPAMRARRDCLRVLYKPGRYALCGDFHVPFHSQDALHQMISMKGDFDGCIIAGDLLDCYDASRFMKDMKVLMSREIAEANEVVDRLAKRFGRVLMFKGNHEERIWKNIRYAAENMIAAGHGVGQDMAPDVYAAAKRLLAIHNGELNCVVHDDWWMQIGSCIFAHGDKYIQTKGKAAEGIVEHFLGRADDYGIKGIPTLVTQNHTHRAAGPGRWMKTWCWEMPAMCGPLDYQMSSKAHKGHTDTGWAVVTMKPNGDFNYNESRVYLVER